MEGGRPAPEKVMTEVVPARPMGRQVLLLGCIVVFGLLIPLVFGLWLDGRLQTAPWFMLAGMVLGTLTATTGVLLLTRARYRGLGGAKSRSEVLQQPATPPPTE